MNKFKRLICAAAVILTATAVFAAGCTAGDGDGTQTGGGHTHTYGALVAEKSATCTQTGVAAHYYCEGCEGYFDERKNPTTLEELTIRIDQTAHTFGALIPEVSANCEHEGTRAHYLCAWCGKFFDDKKVAITAQELTIPSDPQAHSFTRTNINPWRDYKYCEFCKAIDPDSLRNHEFESGSTKCKYCDYECDFMYYAANSDEDKLQIYGFREGGEKADVVVPAEWCGYEVIEVDNFDDTDIESITIPSSVKIINKEAFDGCDKLKTVTIEGNSLTEIGNSAFYQCSALNDIRLPESVIKIGMDAFHGCSSLEHIELSPNLNSLGSSAFENCESLLHVDIPDNLTYLNGEVFLNCKSLQIAEISENSKIIDFGRDLFRGCEALTEIKIPKNLETISAGAFAACTGLKKVILHGTVAAWAQIYCNGYEANTYYNPLRYAHDLYEGGRLVTDLVIPGSVEWIESNSFYGCSAKSITVEEGVTGIGSSAFTYMLDVERVSLPSTLEEIGSFILNPASTYPDGYSGEPKYHKLYHGTINFNGTMEQWQKIRKEDLGFGSGGSNLECSVTCKNGTIQPSKVNENL